MDTNTNETTQDVPANDALVSSMTAIVCAVGPVALNRGDSIGDLIRETYDALKALGEPVVLADASNEDQNDEPIEGAVTVRKSLANPDFIVSMIDGKPYKALKRHLAANGLTPDQYRARYGLKADYPMVAPSYSEKRRLFAKESGLGRKSGSTNEAAPEVAEDNQAQTDVQSQAQAEEAQAEA